MDTAVDNVWEENNQIFNNIVCKIMNMYKLEHTFQLEARTLFYQKFSKYYEDNKQYMKFMYVCLLNKAKNVYRQRVKDSNYITIVTTPDGDEINALEELNLTDETFYEDMFLDEVYKTLEEKLEWYEYFVFTHLVDGYTKKSIRDTLGISTDELNHIHKLIMYEVGKFYK